MSSPPVAVVREVPKRGQGAWQTYTVATEEGVTGEAVAATGEEKWEPLRINVSYENLEDGKYCKDKDDKVMNYWTGNDKVQCREVDLMKTDKKNELIKKILPEAIKLHTDRLLVKRVKTPLNELTFENKEVCSRFAIPKEVDGDKLKVDEVKLSEADFLLYVASGSSGDKDPASFALTCAVDAESKRPIIGAMHVKAEVIKFGRSIVRLLAHELGHALGFDYKRMLDLNMTAVHNIRGENRTVVNSTNVLKKAKEHYNCDTMEGVEL
ncbi:putative surface protease GP63, partial [Trypanosoma theileri]